MPEEIMETNRNKTHSAQSLSSQKFITKMINLILISVTAILVRTAGLMNMHKKLPDLLDSIQSFDLSMLREYNHREYIRIMALAGIIV